ncbi:AAA family ATPase [Pseudopontixanthobacter vadosimaris]|uniref:AAA family ATPase n=1 Tax=Pseudopontixanthobacter vadosimaris TaxID=2726450 RepID=UPI001473E06B|nr:AAA family ATPase [Pseudopontixanthobacter vadosimaris]
MTNLREIATAMGGEVSGNRACFPTPGHSNADRGSWASLAPGAPDGVLIHSSNGGDPLAIKDELRAKGILPDRMARNDNVPWHAPERAGSPASDGAMHLAPGQRIVATFTFEDAAGNLLYRKHRIEPGDDGRGKTFRFDRPDGRGGWQNGQGDDRIPYRLPDLVSAPHDMPIFMAEGEAKADKLAGWGFLATSHKDWKSFEFSGYVKGRTVYILPDNDEAGAAQAAKAKDAVEKAGGTPHLIELPGLPDAGDILDWTGTAADLRKLIDRAGEADGFESLDLSSLATQPATAKQFVIDRLAPRGEVTLFTGAGSAGKSLLAQQLATAAAAGMQCLRLPVDETPAIYVTCEDDARELHWRQEHICKAMGVPMATLADNLHLVSLRGRLDNALGTFGQDGALRPAAAYNRLVAKIRTTSSRLVLLDNVAHLFTGNENDRGQVTQFVNLLNRLAGETGAAIILLGHPSKGSKPGESGHDYSGSTAWLNAVRSHFTIEHDLETDIRTINVGKANYAKKGEALNFRWHDFAFWHDDDLPDDTRADMDATIKMNGENAAFMRCLESATKKERAVSHNPGSNYAPKVFAAMIEGKGLSQTAFKNAMERLIYSDKIALDQPLWRGSNRVMKQGIKAVEICTAPPAPTPCIDPHETRRNPARFNPPISKDITGAANRPAAPDEDEGWIGEAPAETAARWEARQ